MTTIAENLRGRTFNYTLRLLRYCRRMPQDWDVREINRQLLRAAIGTTGNYWSACRGRSGDEFISKLAVAEDEASESVLWLMLIQASGISRDEETVGLLQEGREITAILSARHKTARENRRRRKQIRHVR